MLKKLRIILAAIFFIGITLLFVDFTGALKGYLGWMAKLQFLPALLAGNVVVVGLLLILTLFFGRIYCSVICPLGVMQDIFFAGGIKAKKNRCSYSPAKKILKYTVLVLFVVALVLGANALVAVIAPYSAYGRIAQSLLAPVYAWVNNIFAYFAERSDSYAFYSTEVWIKGVSTLLVAIVTLLVLAVLAWRNGRTWCNTICPVGTVLGWFAKFSAKNGLPHIHPHAFRHTAASIMIASGIDLVTTANELGHANATTTATIYAHQITVAKAKASEARASVFLRVKAGNE